MPRTRIDVDRDEKVAEILDHAEVLFLDRGYSGTTMAELARAAGVATNAIYWYFPSKDDLFVAVVRRLFTRVFADARPERVRTPSDLESYLLAVFDGLAELSWITAMVHDRARESEVVANLHHRFHESSRAFYIEILRTEMKPREAELTADAMVALLEGVLTHESMGRPHTDVVRHALRRLTRRS